MVYICLQDPDKFLPLGRPIFVYTEKMLQRSVALLSFLSLIICTACGQADDAEMAVHPVWIEGVDLSHHNGRIDWDLLDQSDIGFVYLKATEGRDLKDPRFQENWREAVTRGWSVGAYHYYRLCVPGEVQAVNFMQSVEVRAGTLPPAIDLEYAHNCSPEGSEAATVAEIRAFLNTLEAEYGQRPVIYTTPAFHADWIAGRFDAYPLWMRSLGSEPDVPHVIWQYDMTGRIRGIDGPVDLNRMHRMEGSQADQGPEIRGEN